VIRLFKESSRRQQEATPLQLNAEPPRDSSFFVRYEQENRVNNYDMMIGRQAACLVTSANTTTLIRDRNGDFPWADCTLL
jgi:hypothetical protein